MDSDLLNLLIKKLLESNQSSTKLIIMSATLQASLFGQYFTPAGEEIRDTIFVGAKRYHVDVYFLDEWKKFNMSFKDDDNFNGLLRHFKNLCQNLKENERNKLKPNVRTTDESFTFIFIMFLHSLLLQLNKDASSLIISLLAKIVKPDICVLIFLPGIGEIESLQEEITTACSISVPLQTLILHSLLSREEQEAVILPAAAGQCKVILSTNIAESSITIPDVLYIIDSGLHR